MTEHENPWLAAAAATANKQASQRSQPPPLAQAGSLSPTTARDGAAPHATNPFLPPAVLEPTLEDDGEYAPVMVSGPATPTYAPAPGQPLLALPERFDRTRAHPGLVVQVAGLHGGAGTSSVAAILGNEGIDCGRGLDHLVSPDLPVVLVARTHACGLHLVKRAAAQWASGGLNTIRLLGVVLVDDAPTLSRGLHREMKSIERALPHSWRIAWSEDWRHDPHLPSEATKGRLRRIRKSLTTQAKKLPRENATGTTTRNEGTA